jgi:hypothetical protein
MPMEIRMKKLMLIATTCVLLVPQFVLACPMCKDSIPGSDANEAGSLPGGFNESVYMLLIGLFCCIAMTMHNIIKAVKTTPVDVPGITTEQSSRGFEVQPSDSSQDEIE